jgi:hypothetical protein
MKIWEPKPPGTLWATPGLLRDTFTFTMTEFKNITTTSDNTGTLVSFQHTPLDATVVGCICPIFELNRTKWVVFGLCHYQIQWAIYGWTDITNRWALMLWISHKWRKISTWIRFTYFRSRIFVPFMVTATISIPNALPPRVSYRCVLQKYQQIYP